MTSLTSAIILPNFSNIFGKSPVIEMLGNRYTNFMERLLRNFNNMFNKVYSDLYGMWLTTPTCVLFQIAREEEKGVYLNFLNFLINDSIYLLDESLNKILEHKELEAEMSNTAEWESRPAQERQERTRLFHSQENVCLVLPQHNYNKCSFHELRDLIKWTPLCFYRSSELIWSWQMKMWACWHLLQNKLQLLSYLLRW